MTQPDPLEAPSLVGAGAQAVVENASRLGLTWKMRLGTITDALAGTIRLDGDSASIGAELMGDMGWINGLRVYVIQIPEGACYVVGQAQSNIAAASVVIVPVANTPTSGAVNWGYSLPGFVHVTATPESAVPGSQVIEVGINQITATGCVVWIYRTNTTSSRVHVIAVGSPIR